VRTCLLFSLLVLLAGSAIAGWDPTVRLTTSDSATHNSMTPARSIAAGPTGCIHVVFYDSRTGSQQIYYKRSADSGSTWSADTLLSNGAGIKGEPAVAASAGCVHAVWEDGGNTAIGYRRSTDAGLTWLAETLLVTTTFGCRNPSVAAQDSFVHVAWADDSAGRELYYRRSTDYGATWSDKVRLTNDMQESWWTAPELLDTFLSGIGLFLVVVRAEIAQTRVSPPAIIEQLDVLDNCCFGFQSGSKPPPVD